MCSHLRLAVPGKHTFLVASLEAYDSLACTEIGKVPYHHTSYIVALGSAVKVAIDECLLELFAESLNILGVESCYTVGTKLCDDAVGG